MLEPQANQSNQEYLLLDYAQRLDRHREDRRAVHVHLSRLKPQNRRDHHIRIAVNTIEDFVVAFEGQIFQLSNADLVFILRGAALAQLDDAVMRLRYLFSEDPLTFGDPDDEGGHGRFATIYNLEAQYPKFLALCEQMHEEERSRQKRLSQMANQAGESTEDHRQPLSPKQLGTMEEILQRADLSNVFKRQAICAVAGRGEPKPIFNELFISILDLAKTVLPDVNLAANRWLFQHLTQTLDRRVLKMLAKADDTTLHSSFSLNLNVNTLLSPEFLEFDTSLRMGSRGTLVIEMQLVDIMADFPSFLFARDFVREKGYRICLDGITPELLPFIDRRRMGIDLVKLNASASFNKGAPKEKVEEITEQVEHTGKGRIILARCDNRHMIDTGQKMGITMFQGHYLDTVLQQLARQQSKPAPKAVKKR
ncbi:EAL domain-containing protein [Aestuariispira insulae]|uniref:EAL domain-containing protein (Putative c-di-GMP-specific phosphodiesterase class I) n=1 Tax=Aestuariispira insulae TaxID=1461337 RepID=A0A3D9HP25_9PROT|nr:EAL domain-containing protein [Aestuariispira insulae]RED51219.1 EAL domain-containing protein (putative c-di-GMP-specific phosphodiesterase class I) [Aestuariispira insulae]